MNSWFNKYPEKNTDYYIGSIREDNHIYQSHASKYSKNIHVRNDCKLIFNLIETITENLDEHLELDYRKLRFRIAGLRNNFHYGNVDTFDSRMQVTINPNSNVNWVEYALIIIHELVHCNQFQTGRFAGTKWEGVSYPSPKNEKEYLDLPWEIEADKKQHELFKILYKQNIFEEFENNGRKSLHRNGTT